MKKKIKKKTISKLKKEADAVFKKWITIFVLFCGYNNIRT